jgi:hypothetical protein
MSSDIVVDIDRALAGDLWVVQETEQLQKLSIKWLEHWLMIRKMNGLKILRKSVRSRSVRSRYRYVSRVSLGEFIKGTFSY